jgi:hypothetical protein
MERRQSLNKITSVSWIHSPCFMDQAPWAVSCVYHWLDACLFVLSGLKQFLPQFCMTSLASFVLRSVLMQWQWDSAYRRSLQMFRAFLFMCLISLLQWYLLLHFCGPWFRTLGPKKHFCCPRPSIRLMLPLNIRFPHVQNPGTTGQPIFTPWASFREQSLNMTASD